MSTALEVLLWVLWAGITLALAWSQAYTQLVVRPFMEALDAYLDGDPATGNKLMAKANTWGRRLEPWSR